jgi:hypothetical protein
MVLLQNDIIFFLKMELRDKKMDDLKKSEDVLPSIEDSFSAIFRQGTKFNTWVCSYIPR